MFKLRRITLSNCGWKNAFFEDVNMWFTDAEDGRPVDTVLSAANGNGKTSALALLFSCFDTDIGRFMRTLATKHERFEHYFETGEPGLVASEWTDGKRIAVICQVVLQSTTGLDRIFAVFWGDKEFGLNSLPFPGLGCTYANRMRTRDQALKWLRDTAAARQDSHEFWRTEKQTAWKERLPSFGIDPQLLAWMVDLNKEEGGITKFLEFSNENTFLAKFLEMALSERVADEARDNMRSSMDGLAETAQTRAALAATEKVHARAATFSASAQLLNSARTGASAARSRHAGLRAVLLREAAHLQVLITTASETRQVAANERAESDKNRLYSAMKASAADARIAYAKADEASTRLTDAQEDEARGKDLAQTLAGGYAYRDIAASDAGTAVLQAQLSAAQKGMEVPEKLTRCAADTYAIALGDAIIAADTALTTARSAQSAAKIQINTAQKNRQEADGLHTATSRKIGALEAMINESEAALRRLTNDTTVSIGETVVAAQARYKAAASQAVAEAEQSRRQTDVEATTATAHRSGIADLRVRTSEVKSRLASAQAKLSEAASQRETLLRLAVISITVEGDGFDPESPAVVRALRAEARRSRDFATTGVVRIRILEADAASIEHNGLAAIDADVQTVVARLRDAGIPDAMPYVVWLARQGIAADEIRALSETDPAVVSGVWVPGNQDLDKARALAGVDLGLTRPVAVRVGQTGKTAITPNQVVFVVGRAEAYDLDAARVALASVQTAIAKLNDDINQAGSRDSACEQAARRVDDWVEKWGGDTLVDIHQAILGAQDELTVFAGQMADLENQARIADEAVKDANARTKEATDRGQVIANQATKLNGYVTEHASKLPEREQSLSNARRDLETHATARNLADTLFDAGNTKANEESIKANTANKLAGSLNADLKGIHMRGDGNTLERLPLEQAKAAYAQAVEAFESLRTGESAVIAGRLKERMADRTERMVKFNMKFISLTVAMQEASVRDDLDACIQQADADLLRLIEMKVEAAGIKKSTRVDANKLKDSLTTEGINLFEGMVNSDITELESDRDDAIISRDQAQYFYTVADQRWQEADAEHSISEKRHSLVFNLARGMGTKQGDIIPDEVELELDELRLDGQVDDANKSLKTMDSAEKTAWTAADLDFRALNKLVVSPEIVEANSLLSKTLAENTFEASIDDSDAMVLSLARQVDNYRHELMQQRDQENILIGVLEDLANVAIQALRRASRNGVVPIGVPRLGGLHVLKTGFDLGKVAVETRREVVRKWLEDQVAAKRTPERGHHIAAELLRALINSQGRDSLGIKILKPTDAGEVEYVPVSAMAASGGERLTAALLLWVVLTKLRAETMADNKLALGGALILDNPIGKASHQLFLRTQRAIAAAMGVQLIFTTGVDDLNAVAEFPHILKFGKVADRGMRSIIKVAAERLGEPRDGIDEPDQCNLFIQAS